jgi:hypothetical protein
MCSLQHWLGYIWHKKIVKVFRIESFESSADNNYARRHIEVRQFHNRPMEAQGEWRYSSYSFTTSARDGVSITPRPRFTPRVMIPGVHWTRGWVGPRADLDTELFFGGKILCLCRGSNLDRPVVMSVAIKQSHNTPMEAQGKRRYSSYSFTTSAIDGVSGQRHAPGALYPQGKDPWYPLNRRLCGSQSWCGQSLEKNPLASAEDRTSIARSSP